VSEVDAHDDQEAIAAVVATFFEAFASGLGCDERLDALPDLFVPGAVVVRTCGGEPTGDDVPGFIEPRRALLTGGGLTEFREWQVEGRTTVFGDVAHHLCSYAKRGLMDGEQYAGRGAKSIQLARTGEGWRITAVAWDDEREGFALEAGWP
jgi:hypothetical protein